MNKPLSVLAVEKACVKAAGAVLKLRDCGCVLRDQMQGLGVGPEGLCSWLNEQGVNADIVLIRFSLSFAHDKQAKKAEGGE